MKYMRTWKVNRIVSFPFIWYPFTSKRQREMRRYGHVVRQKIAEGVHLCAPYRNTDTLLLPRNTIPPKRL